MNTSEETFVYVLLAQYRSHVLRTACAAVCSECRRGDTPKELNDVITANGKPYWHELLCSDGTLSGTFHVCDAAAIRQMMES